MKTKILIIESDRRTRRLLTNLLSENYETTAVGSINEGYSLLSDIAPDIIIINPQYPERDGIGFIKSARDWLECQILAISSIGTEHAAVTVIDAGADDFIRKPFFSGELLARVDACEKRNLKLRAAKGINKACVYKNGELSFSAETGAVLLCDKRMHLTKNELKIFTLLCENSGKVLTYEYILKAIWGPRSDNNTGILRVNITNLRKKLEKDPLNPQYLFTENGIGYRLAENEENPK